MSLVPWRAVVTMTGFTVAFRLPRTCPTTDGKAPATSPFLRPQVVPCGLASMLATGCRRLTVGMHLSDQARQHSRSAPFPPPQVVPFAVIDQRDFYTMSVRGITHYLDGTSSDYASKKQQQQQYSGAAEAAFRWERANMGRYPPRSWQ